MNKPIKIVLGIALVMGVIFLIFRTPDTDVAEMRAKYGDGPSQFIEIADGTTIHLRDEGPRDAPAIILLHGSNADLHTWGPWADVLKEEYRVIRFDQIGHGLTGPALDGDYQLASFVEDVDQVADALELDSFVLGGNSMGGWISMGYALEHADRLTGLVLVDASGSPVQQPEGEGGNIGFTIASLPVINNLMKYITPRSLVEQSFSQSVSVQDVVTEEAVDRYWELLRYPGNRAATIARFTTPRVEFTAEQAAAMPVRTLIVWGNEDALVPVEAGHWYYEHIKNGTLVEYQGIGHLPHEEVAEQSVEDLKNWLVNQPFSADAS